MIPAEMIYLIAWSTLIDNFVIIDRGTNIKNHVVGFGVEGIKTLIIFLLLLWAISPLVSLVRKPIAYIPFCGYSINTTSLNEFDLLPANVSISCLTVE